MPAGFPGGSGGGADECYRDASGGRGFAQKRKKRSCSGSERCTTAAKMDGKQGRKEEGEEQEGQRTHSLVGRYAWCLSNLKSLSLLPV